MTSQEFLQEILDNPDDDTPRLIYADWLQEHGSSARGEFIRLQCEMAKLREPLVFKWRSDREIFGSPRCSERDRPRYRALLFEQLDLFMDNRSDWVAPFEPHVVGIIFDRGFPEAGATTAAAFIRHAGTWYQHAPLRRLNMTLNYDLSELLESRHLRHVTSLSLKEAGPDPPEETLIEPLTDADAAALAASPNLINLRHLRFDGYYVIGDNGIRAILESPYLKNLVAIGSFAERASAWARSALQKRFGDGFY